MILRTDNLVKKYGKRTVVKEVTVTLKDAETRERIILTGEVPSPLNPPPGCPFHQRCRLAIPECSEAMPETREVSPGHQVACIRV